MQSKLIAKRLSKIKFNEVYISDMKRTQITADQIIKALVNKEGMKITESKLVREKNSGDLEGKPISLGKIIANVLLFIYYFREERIRKF